ncbi:YbgA family protein [Arcobacter sp.]|uniref:YbgA family protein n=1 Tax=Arcobacter sp. TaxID=1872629 RepID=UPI003D0CB930
MKLGISSCLIGNLCRYDGAHSKDAFVYNILQKYFEIVPYCPEDMIFGSPRETIRLVRNGDDIKVTTSDGSKDVTKQLDDISVFCAQKIAKDDICGFILKSKSPTCGMERVKVYQEKNAPSIKEGVGLFTKRIKEFYPYLPVEEEGRLNDPWLKENFLMQVFAYKDLHEFLKNKPTKGELVEFHSSYKYLIYAKSQKFYKELGNIVANHEKKHLEEILDEYRENFLKAISEKSSIKKTFNVLLHIFGYFKKHILKEEKELLLLTMDEYKDGIVPLITIVKMFNIFINRYDIEYLKKQKFLNPYPQELALRSDLKAFK